MTTCGGGFAIAQMSAVMFRHTMSAEGAWRAYLTGGPALDWVRRAEKAVRRRPCAAASGRLSMPLHADEGLGGLARARREVKRPPCDGAAGGEPMRHGPCWRPRTVANKTLARCY